MIHFYRDQTNLADLANLNILANRLAYPPKNLKYPAMKKKKRVTTEPEQTYFRK